MNPKASVLPTTPQRLTPNRTFVMVNIKETFKELATRHHKCAIVEVDAEKVVPAAKSKRLVF